MLKSWSQGLLEASKNAANSAFGANDVSGMAAHAFFGSQGPPRKLKKAAAAASGGDKKPKQQCSSTSWLPEHLDWCRILFNKVCHQHKLQSLFTIK
jgi:hypothetical protein